MSKINLLPWREELRVVRNRVFFAYFGISVFISLAIVIGIRSYLIYRIDVQRLNASYVDRALSTVKAQITEIKGLQENKEQLLERMKVIQSLGMDRASTVKLLDLIPRVLPDSIYLVEITRKDPEPTMDVRQKTLTERGQDLIRNIGNIMNDSTAEEAEQVYVKKYTVLLEGIAYSNNGISFLLKKLERVKWISNVKLDQVKADTGGEIEGVGFSFKLSFDQELVDERQ